MNAKVHFFLILRCMLFYYNGFIKLFKRIFFSKIPYKIT